MKTVFFDVDTQIDFVFPAGSLYAPGAERILSNVAKLNRYAAENGNVVISTMDAHAENDAEFRHWPPHCVVETMGQQKPQQTLLESRGVVPSKAGFAKELAVQQILLEKQTFDCFSNANLTALLEQLDADEYVVYGVVTEICVRHAAFGLLKTGKSVNIVTDAVRSLKPDAARQMLAEFSAAGGHLVDLGAVIYF